MNLDDLCARFKVIDSLIKCRKMAKYRLVLTQTLCRVDGCIISIRQLCTYLLNTYLLTQLLGGNKTGNISETVEHRAKVTTVYIKSYTGFRLPPKCMTLNDLWVEMGDEIFTFESFINFMIFFKYFKSPFLKVSLKFCILIIIYW